MSSITAPASIEEAPQKSQPILEGIKGRMGSVPNGFRMMSNAPAVLEGFLAINSALGKGELDAATRERIAIAVANVNTCNYCLAAHSFFGQKFNNLTANEIETNKQGHSTDAKADVAIRFAVSIAENRGTVDKAFFSELTTAGYSKAEIVEIIAHVGTSTLTNYINHVLDTEIDFPVA